jgi:hypothetical protein
VASTQRLRKVAGGIDLSMDVRGTTELRSWVLSFGREAEVLGPEEFRREVRGELSDALAPYA